MNQGTIAGWHYKSRKPIEIAWRDGVIDRIVPTTSHPDSNHWIAPALFDVQVNGFAGVDFQQDDLQTEQLLQAAQKLRLHGCCRFFLTLITDKWDRMLGRLNQLKHLRSRSPELTMAIAGWHIEGPFLSDQSGFHGAHNPALMQNPTTEHIRDLRSIAGSDPLILTLSPERIGGIEAIALCQSLGIIVSLGHTNASAEILRQAVQAGASGFTHLANGCPRELDRHDNIIWRVLDDESLTVGVIPDGIHVSPALFRLMHKAIPHHRIYYTTDAMAAAGTSPGRYTIGTIQVEVGPDEVVRQPGKTNFAGSALRPMSGIIRASDMLQCSWQEVWDLYSVNPAKWTQSPSDLSVSQPAHFCLIKTDAQNQIQELQTWFGGAPAGLWQVTKHEGSIKR